MATLLVAGCGTLPGAARRTPAPADPIVLQAQAARALRAGDADAARRAAELLLMRNLRAPRSHLLLGAAHQLRDDPAVADLAVSGFASATRFGDAGPWPHYLAGVALMRQQRYHAAADAFARAVMAEPSAAWAYEGMAAAAYLTGDLGLAEAAATRARGLDPQSPGAWRTAVLGAAGRNDPDATRRLLAAAPDRVSANDRSWVATRANALLRTAAIDADQAPVDLAAEAGPSTLAPVAPNQLSVDVTLILGDLRRSRGYGVNLLESLQLQFGKTYSRERVTSDSSDSLTSSITRLIRIPDVTYNLNVLNRGNRHYEVIARPSLSAFLGEQSTFFVGEQLNVAVTGVNFAQLERIDVGVGLKITPAEIRADGARFRVEADRSFFSDQGVGSFSQQLATFRQNVAATADVRFGETLVLSGLSESVSDGNESGVPIVGDVPGLNLLFNRKTDLRRQRSVIILVTPSAPVGLQTGDTTGGSVRALMRLWDTLAQPEHGLGALATRIQQRPFFSRASAGDVQARDLRDPQLLEQFLASNGAADAGASLPNHAGVHAP
ncbi:type II and III secretion system protein [Pseudoxanthomonas composti]|nr:type II and III secretion system protein [Pseudoxanthomonas composti]